MKLTGDNRKPNETKSIPDKNGVNGDPISLHPLFPQEAMRRLQYYQSQKKSIKTNIRN